jgi:cobalt-zinc-cadmium efflux system membrane fusion protein
MPEDDGSGWPEQKQTLTIHHLANTVGPASRTFGFYVPLVNQSRAYRRGDRTYLLWRYRPGQRVRLHVPVEAFKDAIVLPPAAVARDGAEAYVFRANGAVFDRVAVAVLYEDRRGVVLADDGSVAPGQFVAMSGAAALNRALKAKQGGEAGHDHHHH